jgi:release factor glutamine methyltransferase
MPSVADRLAAARTRLAASGLTPAEAALDAEVLARHILGWDLATLLTNGREPERQGFGEALDALIERRARREPVAQIVGHREFWGLDFEVTRDVLVPRPETELIVEEALAFARERRLTHIIDVGTGSGCIAIAIASELPDVRITATDASLPAIEVARRNASAHGVQSRIDFHLGDVLSDVNGPAELIVSNPPYVPEAMAAHLQPEVVQYEPHAALFGGETGLEVLATLFEQAPPRLAAGGRLIVEFGFGQRDGVERLASANGWRIVRTREDLQGIPRTLVLARSAAPTG